MIFDSYAINYGERILDDIELIQEQANYVLKIQKQSHLCSKLGLLGKNDNIKLFCDDESYVLIIESFIKSDKEYSYFEIKEVYTTGLFEVENFIGLDFKLNFNQKPYALKERIFDFSREGLTLSIARYKNEKSYTVSIMCNPESYSCISEYIFKIRSFHSLLRGVRCYESDIVYKSNKANYTHIYNSRLNNYSVTSSYGPKGRLDIDKMKEYLKEYEKMWIFNIYNKYEPFILICEYMQRNDFSNPQMYFKEMYSFLDGFINVYLTEQEKKIACLEKNKSEELMSTLMSFVSSSEINQNEKNKIICKLRMVFDNTTRKLLKVLLKKNILFTLKSKENDKLVDKLIETRNKLFHSPHELFKIINENGDYIDEEKLIYAVLFIREILINLIFVEISHQLTSSPIQLVRSNCAELIDNNLLVKID